MQIIGTSALDANAARRRREAHLALARDLAPIALLERGRETAAIADFCDSEVSVMWWTADAWAGKSALAAWTVVHPPDNVDVVAFFVTGRLRGQADATAFSEGLIEQLAALLDEPLPGALSEAAADRERRRLMDLAAARAARQGRRLLLVVDGLDEDESGRPGYGGASIASLLPTAPPPHVKIMLTSRAAYRIPSDVPEGHLLRRTEPVPLKPSPHAAGVGQAALNELRGRLNEEGSRQVDVIALVTVAGGLTLAELADLTSTHRFQLKEMMDGLFGRSMRVVEPSAEPPDAAVYVLGHQALQEAALQYLTHDLPAYRARIDAWADRYSVAGWPPETPRYLLQPYAQLLFDQGDSSRLADLVTEPARQHRVAVTGFGDGAVIREIDHAQRLCARRDAGLARLSVLTVRRAQLEARNNWLPSSLPATWAVLGDQSRAYGAASSMSQPIARVMAFIDLADAVHVVDEGRADDFVHQAARLVPKLNLMDYMLVEDVMSRWADNGRLSQAGALAHAAGTDLFRTMGLMRLLTEASTADDAARLAEEVAPLLAELEGDVRQQYLPKLITTAARHGRWAIADHALNLCASAACRSLCERTLGEALASAGQPDRALKIAERITAPRVQGRVVVAAASAFAAAGAWKEAFEAAKTLRPFDDLTVDVIARMLVECRPDRVAPLDQLMSIATRMVSRLSSNSQSPGAAKMATALARAGRFAEAEVFGNALAPGPDLDRYAAALADVLIEHNRIDEAVNVSTRITTPGIRLDAMSRLAAALAEAGMVERAFPLLRQRPWHQALVLDDAEATVVGIAVDANRAELAADYARNLQDDLGDQAWQLIADRHARAGRFTDAEAAAASCRRPVGQLNALLSVLDSVPPGDIDLVRRLTAKTARLARILPEHDDEPIVMTRVFAREVLTTDRHVSAEALARLAGRVARLDNRLAARLATEAADVALASAGAPVRAELLVAVAVILLRSRAPSFEAVVEQALAVLATRGTNVVPMALSLAAAATTRSAPLVLRAAAVAAEAVVRLQREKQDSQQTFETLTRIMIDARCWADAERYLDACGRDPMALRTDLIAVARYDDPELAQRCAQRPLGNPGARYRISYYLTRQLWSCAADEARRSPDGDSVECLCQVAVGVTDADPSLADALLDEALDRTATAAAGRPESYAAVVAALAVRDPQRAAALVPEALHEHESMDDPWQRLLAAPPMAGALAKVAPDQVAQFVAGVELVARMSAEIPVHQRLCRLIETCRAARLTDRALLLADEVEHLAETATGYGDRQRGLIELLRTLGELPAASLRRVGTAAVRAVLDFRRDPEAERADLLLATSDLSYLTVVRRDLTWALAGAQLWDTAEDFIAQISDRHEQADNARLLTECLLDDGRLTAAARMLRLAQPGVERDLAYARLAEQLDELDSWDEARAAITAVDNSEAQAAALDNHLRHLATACQKATGETRMYLEGLVRSLVAEIVVARNSLQAVGLGAAALPEEAEAAAWAAYQLLEAAAA